MHKTFWPTIVVALAAYVLLPLAGLSAPLNQRIQKKRSQIEKVKSREGVLTTTISGYNNRIDRLQGEIRGTQQRLGRVQGELDRKRNELARVRDRLERSRDRLERLRRELRTARRVLAARLVGIYKSDKPDALTVVLEADGFADLLERTDHLERISDQDRGVTDHVRALRDKSQKETDRLAALERQVRIVATQILQRRDEIASARDQLVGSRASLREARNARRTALASVRDSRHGLEEDLEAMEREQARIQAQLAGAGQQLAAGPIKRGSGRFIWPVNGPITGAFGEARPGHMHAGIDISAPSGTPIRAADSGRVVLMAYTGGYGNYTCVQHTGSLSSCYAHQSRFGTSSGAGVRQGQVIGYVGNTGSSTGPHLHFEARVGGSPVSPLGYL
jgi:murein DD-endopeptidase MepM/ murein hydrolase activator NlpD